MEYMTENEADMKKQQDFIKKQLFKLNMFLKTWKKLNVVKIQQEEDDESIAVSGANNTHMVFLAFINIYLANAVKAKFTKEVADKDGGLDVGLHCGCLFQGEGGALEIPGCVGHPGP